MHFETPGGDVAFDIPDEWWRFAEMDTFTLRGRFIHTDRVVIRRSMRYRSPTLNLR